MVPSSDPKADQLVNSNLNQAVEEEQYAEQEPPVESDDYLNDGY